MAANVTSLFNIHVDKYEKWYEDHPVIFQSEVEAIREMLPEGEKLYGIEVGVGTGRFAEALKIKEGVEPAENMRALALEKGVETVTGTAEHLPFGDLRFDFVLMVFCISYMDQLVTAFKEAFRVLKNDGVLIVAFLDKESAIGRSYIERKPDSTFYKSANFYSVEKVEEELRNAAFKEFSYNQTLFGALENIKEFQSAKPGYGEGSFVVVAASKKGTSN